jgi:protein tyrosine/serine phosphatase/pimeloyl-ACP methyl ester carboxylesterase
MTKYEVPEAPREIVVRLGKGVVGVIAIPHSVDCENKFEKGYAPATNKAALIIHGQGGHRNYCYQKMLAHRLASDLGIYSLRIDFRGCGDSDENESKQLGRVISQDVEDIQAAAEFLIDGTKNPLGINFTLSSIIAHSRGAVAMFLWALKQNEISKSPEVGKAIVVPNLVNCSSRFRSYTVLDRYNVLDSELLSLPQRCLRYGKMQDVAITREELFSLATPDLSPVSELPLDWSVLSIYGLEDVIVPIQDSSYFANHLTRGYYSHKLQLIPRADHNFYGQVNINDQSDAEEFNPDNLPLTAKKLVNYNYVVTDMIIDWLDPTEEAKRFVAASQDIGRFPRWKTVEGVSNFRDLGGWKIHNPTFHLSQKPHNQYYVKPGVAYRCAKMTNITSQGITQLQNLNVKTIFDLRSNGECKRDGISVGIEDAGIQRIHAPVFAEEDFSPEVIAIRYKHLMTSWSTIVHVYEDILENGTNSFKQIFEYIRDDCRPFVFHCTAGKDRTGIVGMLLLVLLGVDKNTVAKEYELTSIGLKADHPQIKDSYLDMIDKLRKKLGVNANEIEQMIAQGRKNWSLEDDGFENLISSRYEAMLATYEVFHKKYGGVVQYFTEKLGFSEADVKKIYQNMIELDPENGGFITNNHVEWTHRPTKAKI